MMKVTSLAAVAFSVSVSVTNFSCTSGKSQFLHENLGSAKNQSGQEQESDAIHQAIKDSSGKASQELYLSLVQRSANDLSGKGEFPVPEFKSSLERMTTRLENKLKVTAQLTNQSLDKMPPDPDQANCMNNILENNKAYLLEDKVTYRGFWIRAIQTSFAFSNCSVRGAGRLIDGEFFDRNRMQTDDVASFMSNVHKVGFLMPHYQESDGNSSGGLSLIDLVSLRQVPLYAVGIPSQNGRADFGATDSLDFLSHDISHAMKMLEHDSRWLLKNRMSGGLLEHTNPSFESAPSLLRKSLTSEDLLAVLQQFETFSRVQQEPLDQSGLVRRYEFYAALAPIIHLDFPSSASKNLAHFEAQLAEKSDVYQRLLEPLRNSTKDSEEVVELLFYTHHEIGMSPLSVESFRTIARLGACKDPYVTFPIHNEKASRWILERAFELLDFSQALSLDTDWCTLLK
jgi:hypothetical protein